MRIVKAKLVKGSFLEVSFSDGLAETQKSYPNTEAPPKLLKAFMAFNHHLCDLTEQFSSDGQPDYDMVSARGYSLKNECIVITGVRTLSNERSITLNSPKIAIEIADNDYNNIKSLVECLDNCRTAIEDFMENNKAPVEIQGNLFKNEGDNVILDSQKSAEQLRMEALAGKEVDVTHLYIKDGLTEQEQMDAEMPLTEDMAKAANKRRKAK